MVNDYSAYQNAKEIEYRKAWETAPPEFLEAAEKAGLFACIEKPGNAMEYDDNRATGAVLDAPQYDLDTIYELMAERHGVEHAEAIKNTIDDFKVIMNEEILRVKALSIYRLLCFFFRGENKNTRAIVFAAMHAIPRFAAMNGFTSMRESARACGVSVEWIRRSRNEICEMLQLPIPKEGTKKLDARLKYQQNGKANHWRKQTTKTKGYTHGKQKIQSEPAIRRKNSGIYHHGNRDKNT